MPFNKNIALSFVLLCFLSTIIVYYQGCSEATPTPVENPAINYKTYEMKADDVRLQYLNHPLISFEYPEVFRLIDLNLPPSSNGNGGFPMTYGRSDVEFTVQTTDLPEPFLQVRIQKPGVNGYNDASDKFKDWVSIANTNADDITIQKIVVLGISADYLESYGTREEYIIGGVSIYPEHQASFRAVAFDYAGLIWFITLDWSYRDSEPPEVQEYFNHILSTFKILDTGCANVRSGNELNVTINFKDGVFTLTNNEDVMLCDVRLFLNYTGDDLSTGYQCFENSAIPSHYTKKITDWQFKNIDTQKAPPFKPFKLLVQAEFPGCNTKIYSYLKTWE